jgi:hypothetical protein
MLTTNNGWPRALEACKGDGSRMLLDEDKKGSLKAKENWSMVFGLHLL